MLCHRQTCTLRLSSRVPVVILVKRHILFTEQGKVIFATLAGAVDACHIETHKNSVRIALAQNIEFAMLNIRYPHLLTGAPTCVQFFATQSLSVCRPCMSHDL